MTVVSTRLWRSTVRCSVLVLALTIALAGTAWAHGKLKSAQPAKGAQLSVAPTELRLEFTESPEVALARFELLGPDGGPVDLGPLTRGDQAGRTLVAVIRGGLTNGMYTVKWRIAGADGHPVNGSYQFSIAPTAAGLTKADTVQAVVPSAGAAPSPEPAAMVHHDPQSMPEGDGFGVGSVPYVLVRWLLFAGLLTLIGAVAFRFLVLRLASRSSRVNAALLATLSARVATAGVIAAGIVGIAAVLRLLAQSYAMHGASDAWAPGLMITMLMQTTWGWGWLLQVAGVVVAATGFIMARRASAAGWMIAVIGTLMLAITPALSGHAIAAPKWTLLVVLADTLHVIGAGGWLGSLLMLVAIGVPTALRLDPSERGPAVAELVNAFSPTALVFAGISASTGVFAAWIHMGSIPALWRSEYGQTLLWKLAILSVVAGTGAYNWLRVRPALGNEEGARRIRRSGTVELVTAVVVLLVTAVLVATSTSLDAAAMDPRVMP